MRQRRRRRLEVARRVVSAKIHWQHPLYLVHALTARCNARCEFCAWSFYDAHDQMTTEEIEKLYSDARRAGFVGLSMWGGEPLLHKDSARIFRHAHKLGFTTNLITNGFLLQRKMDQVVNYIDKLSISVDHPSSKHDEWRKINGLFERIVESTKEVRRLDPDKKIIYVYTLQNRNSDEESIRKMAELLKSLGVVGIFNALRVEAATEDTNGVDLERFNPSQEQLTEAFNLVRRLKEDGYPILNSFTHIDKMKKGPPVYRCHWPKFMLPVEANGDVVDCMAWGVNPLGNVRETSFAEILKSKRLRQLAGKEGENCHKCVSLHRIEVSEMWEGNLEPLVSWWSNLGERPLRQQWQRLQPVLHRAGIV